MTKVTLLMLVYSGVMIEQLGRLIDSPSTWRVAFLVTLGLLLGTVTVQIQPDARRAKRFLARHPEPE